MPAANNRSFSCFAQLLICMFFFGGCATPVTNVTNEHAQSDRAKVLDALRGYTVGKTTEQDLIKDMAGGADELRMNTGQRMASGWVVYASYRRTQIGVVVGGGPPSTVDTQNYDVGYAGGKLATLHFVHDDVGNGVLISVEW